MIKRRHDDLSRVSTGIPLLDRITSGGLPKGELYVVNGEPGAGKTVLALHFLKAGVEAGETALCLTLSQRVESLQQTAASVGIDSRKILFRELSSAEALESLTARQTVFDTSEFELESTMSAFTQVIDTVKPQRVVFDSISYLRMLANNPLSYRRQLLILRDYMASRDITVLLTDTPELAPGDKELVAIAHGVITLSIDTTAAGSDYRYLKIAKIRGSDYHQGIHNVEISDQGMQVYPLYSHPPAAEGQFLTHLMSTGIPKLDDLVGGGLLSGTSCLLLGASGLGKTTIASLFAHHQIQQGGKASIFLFDELPETFLKRSRGLGLNFEDSFAGDPKGDRRASGSAPNRHPTDDPSGQFRLHELRLGNISPGKFAYLVAQDVAWGAKVVVIDSLTGYVNAMPNSKMLITQMHELMKALSRQNVLTILVVGQRDVIGSKTEQEINISYLADTVLLLRYFEAAGTLRRAISVYKKRYGAHERGIREMKMESDGIYIGELLRQFTGILSGMPDYMGEPSELIEP